MFDLDYPDSLLIRFIERYYKYSDRKKTRFLDVGCRNGSSSWYLAREDYSVAAMDSHLENIENLKKRLEKDNLEAFLACGDLVDVEFKDDFFDGIIDIMTLYLLPENNYKKVMKGLFRVLKTGGRLFSMSSLSFNKDDFSDFSKVDISSYEYNEEIDGDLLNKQFYVAVAVK